MSYRVIGTRPIRPDGYEKVTGRARYGADIQLPGMLYGQVLRSPHPHARIVRIDASRALAHPGVHAVITRDDMPKLTSNEITELGESAIGRRHMSHLVLAQDKALFKGHPIAAVAAVDVYTAQEALSLIEVEYEVLPPVEDVLEAMKPSAPLLHDDVFTWSMGKKGDRPSNVARHIRHVRGDVEAGFREADVIVEREFVTQMVHQGYIEPQNATAQVNPDGRITIWTSTQGSFGVRDQVATILRIPEGQIKVVPLEIGGGFGGKVTVYLEPLAVLLARKSGRPVKMVMNRAEVFQATGPGSGTVIRLKLGAKRTGELVAAEAWLVYDAGAYPGSPVGAACLTGLSPYTIPHFMIDGYDVVTNKPRVQAYRAPGATPIAFAVETLIDEVAEAIGMDPIDFRLKNAVAEGDRRVDNVMYNRIGFREVLEAVRNHPHYQAPLEGPNRGRGVACGFWMNGSGTSSCHLTFNSDGSVNLIEGSTDIGGSRASMAMIVAEELGLSVTDVFPQVADTESVGYNDVTGGSRVTYSTGVAVSRAARNARNMLAERAAKLLEVDPADVEFALEGEEPSPGVFRSKTNPEKRVTVKHVISRLNRTGGPITASGTSGGLASASGFGAHLVDLEVDPETGKVQILRFTAFQDVGKAIHPSYVEGQLQGGVAQGVGWGLTEEYVFEQGVMKNPTLLDYRMPTALDLPFIDTVLVEVPASDGPYGVRGVGEVPIVPPPAALANAIYRAIGVRLTELPMSPERVWRALQQGQAQRQPVAG